MLRCGNGYEINEDDTPSLRCHNVEKYHYKTCKQDCPFYNHEYDLIERAIDSAKCRKYRLRIEQGLAGSYAHQEKAKNQLELMNITIKALEYYRTNN